MAAETVNLHAIAYSAVPMLSGCFTGKRVGSGTIISKAREELAPGKINNDKFFDLIASFAPTVDYCNTMGAAATMKYIGSSNWHSIVRLC